MKKCLFFLSLSVCFFSSQIYGQMVVNGKTLAGNEWIDYSQTYYKIRVGSDGIYRVKGSTLASIGIDIKNTSPSRYQLWQGGKEQPILVSTNTNFTDNDYLEFYGTKHRIQLDTFMYKNWRKELLNTEFSLCTDTTSYFLSIAAPGITTARIKNIEPNYTSIATTEITNYLHKEKLFFNNIYYSPLFEGLNKIKYSNFIGLEGFSYGPTELTSVQINANNIDETAPLKASLKLRFGLNMSVNSCEIRFNNELLKTHNSKEKIIIIDTSYLLGITTIKSSNTLELKNVGLGDDRNLLAVVELNYPRKFLFDDNVNQKIHLSKGKNYFTITGISKATNETIYAYTLNTGIRVKYGVKDNKKKLYIENANEEDVYLYTDQNVNLVTKIEKKNFIKYDRFNASYMAITSKKFKAINENKKALEDYLSYRRSSEGGNYDISEVNVEDIYDEFGWGNENHMHAFRNFTYFLKINNTTTKYICLFGKGREYITWRVTNNPEVDNRTFFIPTYGDYPSDELLFTQGYETYSNFEIGRIAVENANDLSIYLDKVKEFEDKSQPNQTIENDYWKKKFLHLSGGGSAWEQQSIKNYLIDMENIIEKPQYGGDVTTFYKTTTEAIDGAISTKIRNLINEGLSYITFFGHSGPGTWDVNVEDPEKWQNKGKYPLIISLGCFSGNVHSQYKGIGEKFLFLRDKGGIAFLASSGSALLNFQGQVGGVMYGFLSKEAYGSTLGDLFGLIKQKYKSESEIGRYTFNQQFTLLGDPAIRLHGSPSADYTPDGGSLTTLPAIVGSGDKTFDVNLDVYNLGKYIEDSLEIRVVFQNIERNQADSLQFKIASPGYKSRITLTIPNKGINALGRNKLFITLDPNNKIAESPDPQAEKNNEFVAPSGEIGYEFYILDNTAKPVFPPDFGIVNTKPTLRIATSNAFAAEANYYIQIDTTALFNSPSLYASKVVAKGGTFKHEPNLNFLNNTVYYWRVSPDSINANTGFAWQNSSFVYLENSPEGWNQSHYFQYKKNPFNYIYVNDQRRFAFSRRIRSIEIVNGKFVSEVIGYKVDFGNPSESIRPWAFTNGTVSFAILDPIKATHVPNLEGQFGSLYHQKYGWRCFTFKTETPAERKKIIDFIKNDIPDGFYVSFFNVYLNDKAIFNFKDWEADSLLYGESIVSLLRKQGAYKINDLKNRDIAPYTFIFKNNEMAISEGLGEDINEVISNKLEFDYSGQNGNLTSILVGPAKSWKNVLWNSTEVEAADSTLMSIIGIDKIGNEVLLINKTNEKNIDISSIDTKKYPYLKLDYYCSDNNLRTPPQLEYWRVLANPLPDGEIDPELSFSIPDSIQQGQPLVIKIGIANNSTANLDSLLTKLVLTGDNGLTSYVRKAPLVSTNKYTFENTFDTKNFKGNYTLGFEINPESDQPESEKLNNIGLKKLKVLPDRVNPLMDVSFDGVKIINGDIVAPKPLIKVELKDENKYLLLNNAGDIEIILQFPNLKKKTYTAASPEFKFTSAQNSENNVAYVEINPELEDGDYLLKVKGKDISGNSSGNISYEVTFKVVTKQSVSNVLNYPNPFSSSTKFLFTITGKVPQSVRIQIMTLSGKVVKEITENEIGPLKVGDNMTQYSWNGTDDFGSRLANGVYLYKVVFKGDNGLKLDLFENKKIDNFISNGFGKLVIIK
jgi:hypothetical protein